MRFTPRASLAIFSSPRHRWPALWRRHVFGVVKPAIYVLLVFSLLAIFVGVFLPLDGEPVVSMALWFGQLSGAATWFCRFACRSSVAHVTLREWRLTRIQLRCHT
jgi:hypothetical protein